jgi:hypothetical protein
MATTRYKQATRNQQAGSRSGSMLLFIICHLYVIIWHHATHIHEKQQ